MISSIHHINKSTSVLNYLGIIILLFNCPNIDGSINVSDSIFHQYIEHYNNDQNSEIIELAKSTSQSFPLSKEDSIAIYQHVTHNPHYETFLLLSLAIFHEKNQQTNLAIEAYTKITNTQNPTNELVTFSLNQLYFLYANIQEIEKCQKISLQLLDIYSSTKNYHGLAQVHLYLARIYLRIKSVHQAIEHLDKAIVNNHFINDTRQLLDIHFALGAAYLLTENHTDAKKHFNIVIENPETPRLQHGNATFNLATIYLQNNDYDKAINFLNQSLKIYTELSDSTRISNVKNNLAHIHIRQENYSEAIENLYSVADFAKNTNNEELLSNVYYNLLQTFINLNQPDSALLYLDKYIDLNSELWNDQQAAHILELEKKYQFENQQKQIELLKTEDELQKAKIKNIQIILIVIVILSMLFLTGGLLFYRQKQRIRKSHKLLVSREKEIHRINSELHQSNSAKDRILSIIGHDLRGPVGSLRDLSGYYLANPNQSDEEIHDYLKMSFESSTSIYYLLDNLLTWANSQKGTIHFSSEKLNLRTIVLQITNLLNMALNQKQIQFQITIPEDLYVLADQHMLKTIFRNLISNAIKFSSTNSVITIAAKALPELQQAEISVEDQGVGIDPDQISNLFQKKETFFLQKSGDSGGTGLGLILCKEFVEIHGGEIWASSEINKGTKICFTLHLSTSQCDKNSDGVTSNHTVSQTESHQNL